MTRVLSVILLLCVCCDSGRAFGQKQDDTFRVDVKLVSVFATVTDASGAPLTDLAKEQFTLMEDGSPQKIAVFQKESELPLSIVLAIDASQSVRKDLRLELKSAKRFIDSLLRPVDALSLYQFNESVTNLQPFTSNRSRIDRGLSRVRIGGGTALYDAIYLAGQDLLDRSGRKVMVLITDGGDTVSAVSYKEAVRAAQQAEAIVYSVVIVPISSSAGRNTGGEHALIQLSKDTGGKHYYAESVEKLDSAFEQIGRELRTQYLLGYYPSRRLSDSDFREIKVAVERNLARAAQPAEPLKVFHRKGYYTSKQD